MKRYILPIISAALLLTACSPSAVKPDAMSDDAVAMWPDYAEVTFPHNIAAPSFLIRTEADEYQTEIGRCGQDAAIVLRSSEPAVEIPLKKWKSLLSEAKGDSIYFRFALKRGDSWTGHPDIVCPVSADAIDPYLCYRLIYPGYELWTEMGIYQRDLTTYEQVPLLENKDISNQCLNCHNFSANDPQKGMMLHVRGDQGGTLLAKGGEVVKVNSRIAGLSHGATYPSWDRDGRLIAFSANNVSQVFHSSGTKPIEVIDRGADLIVYDTNTRRVYTDSLVNGGHHMETFPHWTPDGKSIYFCRALPFDDDMALDTIRYNLCRIDFDAATGRFSNFEEIYDARAEGKSVSFPRVSPDGKYLMFVRSNYGNFSIWHPEAQLMLMDLASGEMREMDEVNSDDIESYHSWSSDGKWFVFSSKRMDGLWARPFIARFDPATGHATKPFPVPQPSADYYDRFTRTYNIPELTVSPVDFTDGLFNAIATDPLPGELIIN